MNLKEVSLHYNIPYWNLMVLKKRLKIPGGKHTLTYSQINLIVGEYSKKFEISLETKLLIFGYKEKWPMLDAEDIAYSFCLNLHEVRQIFKDEYLIIPSKINN
jgi:hypothetical protein